MHYSLNGNYLLCLPPYLQEDNYKKIREICSSNNLRLTYISNNLLSYLRTVPDNTFSKFNLSDIFEALDVNDNNKIWDEILRTAKRGARIVYWNNLIVRTYPDYLSKHIESDKKLSDEIQTVDRVYFYDKVCAHTINK